MQLTRMSLVVGFSVTCALPVVAQPDAGLSSAACRAGSSPMARTELIFGSERGSHPSVTHAEWKKFVDDEIAPRFPNGFTVLDGEGEWHGNRGIVREQSHVLILWYRASAEQQNKIEALRSIYEKRFQQSSVPRIDGSDCVSF